MMFRIRSLVLCLAVASLPACGGVHDSTTPVGSLNVPATNVTLPARKPTRVANTASNVYVADFSNSTVTVYSHTNGALIRTISQGIAKPDALAVDGSGNLYVSNESDISVYAPGASVPSRTITDGVSLPLTIAIDASGKLYVGNWGTNSVTVYAAGSGGLLQTITSGIALARFLAFDAAGNLYVSNYNNSTVTVYASGKTSPKRTISQGIDAPLGLAFDKSGNLYVANYQASTVTVYAPGSGTPFRTLAQDLYGPVTLTFSSSGDLYASNCALRKYVGCWKPSRYGVTVYGSSSDTPKFQLTDGIDEPVNVLIGASGKAFVANNGHSTLTEYAAGGNTLLKTITQGIHRPTATTLGP